jgi:hypothetical protein
MSGMGELTDTTPKTRRSRAELEELMIEGGVAVLDDHGVEVQISSVTYARVFEHLERTAGIKVTYGSVHERIWDSIQAFQLAVIERSALWESSPDDADDWTSWLRTAVALTSQPDGPVVDAAVTGAQERYDRLDTLAQENLNNLSAESRAALARLSTAVREGVNLRRAITGEPEPPTMLPTGPDGELEEWTSHRLAMWGAAAALSRADNT